MKVSIKKLEGVIKILKNAKYHTGRDSDMTHDVALDVAIQHMEEQIEVIKIVDRAKLEHLQQA